MERVTVLAGTDYGLGGRIVQVLAAAGITADVVYDQPGDEARTLVIPDRSTYIVCDELAGFPEGFLDAIASAESKRGSWSQPRGAGKSRLRELMTRLATEAPAAPDKRERRTAQWKREVQQRR